MRERELLTNKEIEKDIADRAKSMYYMSNTLSEHRTYLLEKLIPAVVIGVLAITAFLAPKFILWEILAIAVIVTCVSFYDHYQKKKRFTKVSIDDYCISEETVESVREDDYIRESYNRTLSTVTYHIYSISFENGKTWTVPGECYTWSRERKMLSTGIFLSTKKGDRMIVVTKKDTGMVVMAYHTDIFEYKK